VNTNACAGGPGILAGSAIQRRGDRLPDQSGETGEHGDGKRDNEVAADVRYRKANA
jgi:hypothetical protein